MNFVFQVHSDCVKIKTQIAVQYIYSNGIQTLFNSFKSSLACFRKIILFLSENLCNIALNKYSNNQFLLKEHKKKHTNET